jgi:hypothetical protein
MKKKIKIELPKIKWDSSDVISPSAFNFKKFNLNPVLLLNHNWKEISIGIVTEVKLSHKGLMFKPIFHKLTDESKYLNLLHKEGLIVNAQPGGFIDRDENGNIKEFKIYEISLCP